MEITKSIYEIGKQYETPFVLLDTKLLETNYERLASIMDNIEIYYAVKANSHQETVSMFLILRLKSSIIAVLLRP